MNKILKLGITLLIISSVAAAILAFSNDATKDKIAEIELENTQNALSGIFGQVEDYKDLGKDNPSEFEAMKAEDEKLEAVYEIEENGDVKGYSVTTVANGFGGPIEIMVGFSDDGEVLGVRVLKHGETAGIGSKAAEPEFTDSFDGLATKEPIEVETISGATVTSEAVVNGVNNARNVYEKFLLN